MKFPVVIGDALAIIPLLAYATVGVITRRYLWIAPAETVQIDLDKQQTASLTLAGFCFTSLSLTISFFKSEIYQGQSGAVGIVFYFSLALACFIASYMALRYRTKNLFSFISDGLIDCGFWWIMLGLLAFFRGLPSLDALSKIIFALLIVYLVYISLHFYYHVQYARKKCP